MTDYDGEAKRYLLDQAKVRLAEAGIESDPEIITKTQMANPRDADRVAAAIPRVADEQDVDHVIMGHHGTGRIGQAIMGRAAETVVGAAEVPTTVSP